MNEYIYISLKHTHKSDGFITMWRPNERGYCWNYNWAGVYQTPYAHQTDSVFSVKRDLVFSLCKTIHFEGQDQIVLPHTKEVRDKLGINLNSFLKKHKSSCPTAIDMMYFLILNS